jgi:hypothetical protein
MAVFFAIAAVVTFSVILPGQFGVQINRLAWKNQRKQALFLHLTNARSSYI